MKQVLFVWGFFCLFCLNEENVAGLEQLAGSCTGISFHEEKKKKKSQRKYPSLQQLKLAWRTQQMEIIFCDSSEY